MSGYNDPLDPKKIEHYTVRLNKAAAELGLEGMYKFSEGEDKINHPKHYTNHPLGVECIQITEHMNFNLGNATKYIWRADLKNGLEDLKKAAWYIQREIERRSK